MDAISYTVARANLSKTMERVCKDHVPVIITRKRESPVVMISLEDYQAMEETAYLLDFTEPVVKGSGADEFYIRSYDDGYNGAIAVSMNLNMAQRIRAFIPNTPSLFDII